MTEQFVVVFMNDAAGSALADAEEQRLPESWAQAGDAAGRLVALPWEQPGEQS